MKILTISDSFKGTLSSYDVGSLVSNYFKKQNHHTKFIPISDGGEGFLDTIEYILDNTNHKIKQEKVEVFDANFDKTSSYYLFDEDTSTLYIELATASGIAKIKKEDLRAKTASTYGTGELLKYAILKNNVKEVIIGIGGSATSDMGSGMLEAMGMKFYDRDNNLLTHVANETLKNLARIDSTDFDLLIKNIKFITLTDVNNPLLGENGSIKIFAPQKGAKDDMLFEMEENFKKFVEVLKDNYQTNFEDFAGAGAGASGGVGFTMKHLFKSEIQNGIDTILNLINFQSLVETYDVIITGEGKYDAQSKGGKVISGIKKYNPKRLIIVCGITDIKEAGVYAVVPVVATVEESMKNSKESLEKLLNKIKL